MHYNLSEEEQIRLISAIKTVFAIPFIDDLEDFILEAALCYSKQIPIVDPLFNTRSKKLFDVVDNNHSIGWSVKGLQSNVQPGGEFELVIQRADVFKKAKDLGFEPLSIDTPPQILGNAVLKHWNLKISNDAISQKVTDKRVAILIKSKNRTRFSYMEKDLTIYNEEDIIWNWTDEKKIGLQGRRKSDNFCIFRWYPNQKQLFERFILDKNTFYFDFQPQRLPIETVVNCISDLLSQ